jgi:hypothetical protein
MRARRPKAGSKIANSPPLTSGKGARHEVGEGRLAASRIHFSQGPRRARNEGADVRIGRSEPWSRRAKVS